MRRESSKFGATVRRAREKSGIGLRKMAKKIGVSPTYLSRVERDLIPPPAEDKVVAIANLLERDPDELLALAGKVSSDVTKIIRRYPREMAYFLRVADELTREQIEQTVLLAQEVQKLQHLMHDVLLMEQAVLEAGEVAKEIQKFQGLLRDVLRTEGTVLEAGEDTTANDYAGEIPP